MLTWILTAFVLYVATVVITLAGKVLLNNPLKGAGDPHRIADPAAVRRRLNEPIWAAWNLARTLLSTAVFGCLPWALALYGWVRPPSITAPGIRMRSASSPARPERRGYCGEGSFQMERIRRTGVSRRGRGSGGRCGTGRPAALWWWRPEAPCRRATDR